MIRTFACFALASVGALAAGAQGAPAPAFDACIQAGTLIAEPGKPAAREQTIQIKDGRIAGVVAGYVGAGCKAVIDQKARTVLPGLIDSHVHITSETGPAGRLNAVTKRAADFAFDGAVFAGRTVRAGFTTVADLGGDPDAVFPLRDAIRDGKIVGPRIVAAGRAMTPSGGHGDVNGYRPEVVAALKGPNACNGADDCRRATREMIQEGADIVKVTATGGVLSNTAAGLAQQLSDDELKAIVDAAHSMGRKVVAHAHGVGGVNAALRAGVDGIEHGTFADAESMKLFKQTGASYVPTLLAGVTVKETAEDPTSWMPKPVRQKAIEVGDRAIKTAGEARKAGVNVVFGTDTGVSKHGDNAREFELLAKAGFTPVESLRMATVGAAKHLGLENETGRIAPGLAADIIAVDDNPLTDISTLREVDFVMARGVVVKP
jgi:imidazolonepropionase-like amidohydrolase